MVRWERVSLCCCAHNVGIPHQETFTFSVVHTMGHTRAVHAITPSGAHALYVVSSLIVALGLNDLCGGRTWYVTPGYCVSLLCSFE